MLSNARAVPEFLRSLREGRRAALVGNRGQGAGPSKGASRTKARARA